MADQRYPAEMLDKARAELAKMAQEPPTQFTKKQIIYELYEEIEGLLERHSYEDVAARLSEAGIEISTGSLKQYFTRARRERQGNGKGKRKAKKAKATAPVETPAPQIEPESVEIRADVNSSPLPEHDDDEVKLLY